MSSYSKTPVFITHAAGWEEVRNHPALAWLEKYTEIWDNNKPEMRANFSKYHTADFSYTKGSGEKTTGGMPAFEAVWEVYSVFAAHKHQPMWVVAEDTENGWRMVGQATMFADLPVPGGEKKAVDPTGKKWDIGTPGMFRFEFVKDASGADGIKVQTEEAYADSGPAIVEMMKRGMIKPEMLMG